MKHQRLFSAKKHTFALAAAAGLMLFQHGANATVESGHWRVLNQGFGNNLGDNLTILVDQTPGGDYTGTFLKYDATAGTLAFVTYNTDEGSTLFVTRPGQVINDDALIKLPAQDALSFSSNVAHVGTDFYLAAATEKFSDPGFQFNDTHWTVFGWAHLKADANGKLQLIDSAMSFNEGGIVTGTLAVPEASTWSMMGLGLFGLAALHRQKTRAAAR